MDISFEFHWNMTFIYSWIRWRVNLLVQSMSLRAVKTALFGYATSSWLLRPPQNPKLVTTFRGLWYVYSVLSLYVQQSKSCDLSHCWWRLHFCWCIVEYCRARSDLKTTTTFEAATKWMVSICITRYTWLNLCILLHKFIYIYPQVSSFYWNLIFQLSKSYSVYSSLFLTWSFHRKCSMILLF